MLPDSWVVSVRSPEDPSSKFTASKYEKHSHTGGYSQTHADEQVHNANKTLKSTKAVVHTKMLHSHEECFFLWQTFATRDSMFIAPFQPQSILRGSIASPAMLIWVDHCFVGWNCGHCLSLTMWLRMQGLGIHTIISYNFYVHPWMPFIFQYILGKAWILKPSTAWSPFPNQLPRSLWQLETTSRTSR